MPLKKKTIKEAAQALANKRAGKTEKSLAGAVLEERKQEKNKKKKR
jgi:hypothetical protein